LEAYSRKQCRLKYSTSRSRGIEKHIYDSSSRSSWRGYSTRRALLILLSLAVAIMISISTITPFTTAVITGTNSGASGLTPRGPIRIIGDNGFTRDNGVVAGSGTADDPYIIEGWDINATGYDYGIYIANTRAYFIIRNCKIYGAIWGGIRLENVTNGKITSNTITDNNVGIFLWYSRNNVIAGNNLIGNGLFVYYNSYNNTIVDNTVNGKPLVYLENARDQVVSGSAGQVVLVNCYNITVENLDISDTTVGIELFNTSNSIIRYNNVVNNVGGFYLGLSSSNTIEYNNIANNGKYDIENYGIFLYYSSNNTIKYNNIANNNEGIELEYSSNNIIEYNNITGSNGYSIELEYSSNNNVIAGNNFINNSMQVLSINSINTWDLGYPVGGNYWSDHACIDQYSGPNQDQPGSDGICDKPYSIYDRGYGSYQYDHYPLAKPANTTLPTTTTTTTTTTPTPTTTTPTTTTSLTTTTTTTTTVTTTTTSTPTIYIGIYSEYGSLFYRGFNLNNTFFVEINSSSVLSVTGIIDGYYALSFSYNESLGVWESVFNTGVLERGTHVLTVNARLSNGSVIAGEYRFYVIDPPPFIRNIIDLGPVDTGNYSIKYSMEFNVLGGWGYRDKRYEIVISVDIKWKPFKTNITMTDMQDNNNSYIGGSWDFGTIELEARFTLSSDGSISISGTLSKEYEAEIASVKVNAKGYASVSGSWVIDWDKSSIDLDFLKLITGLSISGSKTIPTPWGIETPVGTVGVTITILPKISGELTIIFTPTNNKSEYLFNLLPLKITDVRGDIKGSIIVSGQIGGKFRAGSRLGLYVGVAGILGAGVFLHPFNELMRGGGIVGEVDAFIVVYYVAGKYQGMLALLGPGLIYSWGNLTVDDIESLLKITSRLKDIGELIDWVNGSWSGYIVENYSIGGDYSATYHGNALYIYYTYTLPNGSSWIGGYKLVDRDLIDLPNPELEALGVSSPYLFELGNGSLAMLYAMVPTGANVSSDLKDLEILLQMCIWDDSSGKWYKPVNITVDGVVFSYISDGRYIYVIYSPSFSYDTTELRKYSLDGRLLYSKPYPGLLSIDSIYGDKVYVTTINGSILEFTPTSIRELSEARSVGFLRESNLNYILFVNKTLVIYNDTYSLAINLPETAIDAQPLVFNNTIHIVCVTSEGIAIYRYVNDSTILQTYILRNITSIRTVVGENYLYILAQTIDNINSQTGDLALFIHQLREEQASTTVTTTVIQSTTVTTTVEKPTTVTSRETVTETITKVSAMRYTTTETIAETTSITEVSTTTATVIDWSTPGTMAVVLLILGFALGYIIKRK